ncbi:MAG: MFS family permease, partial [Candidatus Azotimanducaceae bacterium]
MSDHSKLWSVFRYRDYRLLWLTLVTGSIVVWMRVLGTAQWLLDETGSAYLVGMIGVVQLVVQLPVTLWAGTLADRVDRKKLMTIAHGATGTSLLILGFMNLNELLTPVLVYIGIAVTAGTHMLASPARSAMVPIVIPEQQLLAAASTDTASSNAAAIAGPLIFAAIAVTSGLTSVFLAAGTLAIVNCLIPMFVKAQGKAEQHPEDENLTQIQQTMKGIRYVKAHPILPGLFLLDAGITTATFYREILPVLALGLFAGGASVTGMLGAANSAGAIVGSFVALLLVSFRAKGLLVLYASFAYGIFLFGFATANTLIVGMIMIALLGAADAVTVA